MLELIVVGMMSCNLSANAINEAGDRQCVYKCQDKSIEYAFTRKQFQCPRVLYVDAPEKSTKRKYRKKDNK